MFLGEYRAESGITHLDKEVWTFSLVDCSVVLTSYQLLNRKTTRHGWKQVKLWDRLMLRDNTCERVEPSFEMIADAVQHFRRKISYDASK